MAELLKCKKCEAAIGSRTDSGVLELYLNKLNMHHNVKVQNDGETQVKCRQCYTIMDIRKNGIHVNEKAANRDLLDNYTKKQKLRK